MLGHISRSRALWRNFCTLRIVKWRTLRSGDMVDGCDVLGVTGVVLYAVLWCYVVLTIVVVGTVTFSW